MNMQYGVMGQQQQQYNTGGQRMNGGGMNNMGGMMNKMNYPRGGSTRPSPYPNPASHMSHKRSQQQVRGQQHHPGTYPGPPPHQQQQQSQHHGGGGMGGAYNGGTCTPVNNLFF
jgi:hypothetical protein